MNKSYNTYDRAKLGIFVTMLLTFSASLMLHANTQTTTGSGSENQSQDVTAANSKQGSGDQKPAMGLMNAENDLVSYEATRSSFRQLAADLNAAHSKIPIQGKMENRGMMKDISVLVFNAPITSLQTIQLAVTNKVLNQLLQQLNAEVTLISTAEGKISQKAQLEPVPNKPNDFDIQKVTTGAMIPAIGAAEDTATGVAAIINAVTNTAHSLKSAISSTGETLTADQDSLNGLLQTELVNNSQYSVYDYSSCLFGLNSDEDVTLGTTGLTIVTNYINVVDTENNLQKLVAKFQAEIGKPPTGGGAGQQVGATTDSDGNKLHGDIKDQGELAGATKLISVTDLLLGALNGTSNPSPATKDQTGGTDTNKNNQAGDITQTGQKSDTSNSSTQATTLANLANTEFILGRIKDSIASSQGNPIKYPIHIGLVTCRDIATSTTQTSLNRFVGEDQAVISGASIIQLKVVDLYNGHEVYSNIVGMRGFELYEFSQARDQATLRDSNHNENSLNSPRVVQLK